MLRQPLAKQRLGSIKWRDLQVSSAAPETKCLQISDFKVTSVPKHDGSLWTPVSVSSRRDVGFTRGVSNHETQECFSVMWRRSIRLVVRVCIGRCDVWCDDGLGSGAGRAERRRTRSADWCGKDFCDRQVWRKYFRLRHRPERKSTRPELQSPCNLVCRLLLEKKKNTDVELPAPKRRSKRSVRGASTLRPAR